MHFRYLHIAILAFALLGGCGTVAPHEALPLAARDKIVSSEVIMPIRQPEIYVFVPPAQAGAGFGLIGALVDISIDSVRSGKAEAAVKPLRNALVDYNFDNTLKSDLAAALTPLPWIGANTVRVIKEVTPDSLEKSLTDSRAGAVLFTVTDYNLSNDGDVLTVRWNVSLFANNDGLRALKSQKKGARTAPANALYRNVISFKTKIGAPANDRDSFIAAWSADNGAAMRAALDTGAAKLSKLLVDDLQRSEEEGTATAKGGTAVKIEGLPGQVIGHDADGSIVLSADGTLVFATPSVLTP